MPRGPKGRKRPATEAETPRWIRRFPRVLRGPLLWLFDVVAVVGFAGSAVFVFLFLIAGISGINIAVPTLFDNKILAPLRRILDAGTERRAQDAAKNQQGEPLTSTPALVGFAYYEVSEQGTMTRDASLRPIPRRKMLAYTDISIGDTFKAENNVNLRAGVLAFQKLSAFFRLVRA